MKTPFVVERNPRPEPSARQLAAWMSKVTIRLAAPSDGPALLRLAALDSASALRGTVLVAEQDDQLVAARSLRDGRSIADPFLHTDHLRALLAVHAAAASEPQRHRGGQPLLGALGRLAPSS
jgi:hypothetical protein